MSNLLTTLATPFYALVDFALDAPATAAITSGIVVAVALALLAG